MSSLYEEGPRVNWVGLCIAWSGRVAVGWGGCDVLPAGVDRLVLMALDGPLGTV